MFLKLFVVSLISFLLLDIILIRFVARGIYKEYLGFLTQEHPNLFVGALIYPLIVAGLVYFVIHPMFEAHEPFKAALTGAFFGLIVYGAYDLTNQATIRKWPLEITVVDMIWGMTLCASVTAITFYIGNKLGF